MNPILQVIYILIAAYALHSFTSIASFHHMFEANREKFDNYTIIALIEYALIFWFAFGKVVS